MANISGRVLLNIDNDAKFDNHNNIGIKDIRVVLKRLDNSKGVNAITNDKGEFMFINVPNGSYMLVESWIDNNTNQDKNIANWIYAKTLSEITSKDPDINSMTKTFKNGNRINSLTPNVIFVEVKDIDVEQIIFLDAEVLDIPAKSKWVKGIENKFWEGNKGSIGYFAEGAKAQSSPEISPYPELLISRLDYEQYSNNKVVSIDNYSVVNIINDDNINANQLWAVADHTTGDEKGRMLLLGDNTFSQVILNKEVNVKKNTNYRYSFWVCNIKKNSVEDTKITVFVRDQEKKLIKLEEEIEISAGFIPTWIQISCEFYSGENQVIEVDIEVYVNLSEENYYLIDDIEVVEIYLEPQINILKTVNKEIAKEGDILEYKLYLYNDGPHKLERLKIKDIIPTDSILMENSIMVDDVIQDNAQSIEIFLSSLLAKSERVLSYKIRTLNNIGATIRNQSYIDYEFTDGLGDKNYRNLVSNSTITNIKKGILSVKKYVDKAEVEKGEKLIYGIYLINEGSFDIIAVEVLEKFKNDIYIVSESIKINGESQIVDLKNQSILINIIKPKEHILITYEAIILDTPKLNNIQSFSEINYRYIDINGNGEVFSVLSNKVNTSVRESTKYSLGIYAFKGRFIIKEKGYIPINEIIKSVEGIVLEENYISIYKNSRNTYYRVMWSINFKLCDVKERVEIKLLLKDKVVDEVIYESKAYQCNKEVEGISGEGYLNLDNEKKYLALECMVSEGSIEILGVETKISYI